MEEKQQKKTFKEWWNERKFVKFCKEHPDGILGIIGGLITVLASVIKIYLSKSEYEDYIFVTDNIGDVHKVPSKIMRTAKDTCSKQEINEAND